MPQVFKGRRLVFLNFVTFYILFSYYILKSVFPEKWHLMLFWIVVDTDLFKLFVYLMWYLNDFFPAYLNIKVSWIKPYLEENVPYITEEEVENRIV